MMALVRNTLTLPGGDPVQTRRSVDIELLQGGWHGDPAETEIIGVRRAQPNESGTWQLDLTPNSSITPSPTFYRAVERVGDVQKVHDFVVPGPVAFTGGSRTSNVVTLTGLTTGHGLEVGDSIVVDAADNGYDGTFTVTVAGATTISYAQTAGDDASSGAGTATKAIWDLFDLLTAPSLLGGPSVPGLTVQGDLSVIDQLAVGRSTRLGTLARPSIGNDPGDRFVIRSGEGASYTLNDALSAFWQGIVQNQTIVYTAPSVFSGGRSFDEGTTLTNPPGVATTMPHQTGFYAAAVMRGDGALFTTDRTAFLDPGSYNGNINGGTVQANSHFSFQSALITHAGTTIVTRTAYNIQEATGAGVVQTQRGVDIAQLLAGTVENTGLRNASTTVVTPSVATMSGVSSVIAPNATAKRLNNTSGSNPLILTSAPTIADGRDGQLLLVVNASTNAVRLTDQGTLASSNLRLATATLDLGTRDSVLLYFSATVGDWLEVCRTNVL
jgi:hypothetical protein